MSNFSPRKSPRLSCKRKLPDELECNSFQEGTTEDGHAKTELSNTQRDFSTPTEAKRINTYRPVAGASAEFNDCGILPSE